MSVFNIIFKKRNVKNDNASNSDMEDLKLIADLIIEEYRFTRSYLSAVDKLFAEEKKRYSSTYTFHMKALSEFMQKFNLNMVNFEGKDYDEGLPVTPLNADEFSPDDKLIIEQTIEPTILNSSGDIIRTGTAILALKPESETSDIETTETEKDNKNTGDNE